MLLDFNDYHKYGPLVLDESQGITKDRIQVGKIQLVDQESVVWTATSWEWFPRYLQNGIENPDYLKAANMLDRVLGSITAERGKGLVVLTIKDGKDSNVKIGKFVAKGEEPSKIDNSDLGKTEYVRYTPAKIGKTGAKKGGGQLIGMATNEFVKGHKSVTHDGKAHYFFRSLSELHNRIITNMKASKYPLLRNESLITAVNKFLSDGATKFDWSLLGDTVSDEDRRQLGKYLVSELGYVFWIWNGISINNFPGFRSIRYLLIPAAADTAGYDSRVAGMLTGGGVGKLRVSSKSKMSPKGRPGATPSIMPTLYDTANNTAPEMLNNKFLGLYFKRLKESSGSANQRAGKSIYKFMIHDVLRLSSINDPANLLRRIKILHKRSRGTLTKEQMDLTEKEVNLIQDAIGGMTLPGIGIQVPLIRTAGMFRLHSQWKEFSKYLSDAFCEAMIRGINHDGASDLRTDAYWQITLRNDIFVNTGAVNFDAVAKGGGGKIVACHGKQTPGDPSRDIGWLFMETK